MIYYLIILVLFFLPKTFAREILIVTEEWPPYNYCLNNKLAGFSTEIVQEILKLIKKDYKIKLYPSLRATKLLNTRPQTMMFSLFRIPEREIKYKWIGPLCESSIYFYKRKSSKFKINSIEDMKKIRLIACRNKGLITNILVKKGFQNLDRTATTGIQIYKKLLSGRCDLAISGSEMAVKHYLRILKADANSFERIPIEIFKSALYIAGSKDISDKEIQLWQKALETLKTNKAYEKIFKKYHSAKNSD